MAKKRSKLPKPRPAIDPKKLLKPGRKGVKKPARKGAGTGAQALSLSTGTTAEAFVVMTYDGDSARVLLGKRYSDDSMTTHACHRLSLLPVGLQSAYEQSTYGGVPTVAELQALALRLVDNAASNTYSLNTTAGTSPVPGHEYRGFQWLTPTVPSPFTAQSYLIQNFDTSPLYRTMKAVHATTSVTQTFYAKFWVVCQAKV